MKCSLLLFGAVSMGVVVLVYSNITKYPEPIPILDHDLTMGKRQLYDTLIFNTTVQKKRLVFNSSMLGDKCDFVVSDFIRWPPNDSVSLDYNITRFEVKDKDKGGYVSLFTGGPGDSHVELYFESRIHDGYKFQVTIYGHLKNHTGR